MEPLRNIKQNNRLFKLLSELGYDKARRGELVYSFTNGRETSSKMLRVSECDALCGWLQGELDGANGNGSDGSRYGAESSPTRTDHSPSGGKYKPGNDQRRKILSICHETGMFTYFNKYTNKMAVSVPRLNGFLLKSGAVKKGLDDLTVAELNKVVTQFQQLQKRDYA